MGATLSGTISDASGAVVPNAQVSVRNTATGVVREVTSDTAGFYVLPNLGLRLDAFFAAVLGLAINYSAYEAEIYRAGLQAVPEGQMEVALALGMSRGLALRRIVLPQAVRIVIPATTNDFIALFKDTSVCSVITVVELTKRYNIAAMSHPSDVLPLALCAGVLYLAMSYPLALLSARLERRLRA